MQSSHFRFQACVGQPQGYSGPAETAQASCLPGAGALQLSCTWTQQREGGEGTFHCSFQQDAQ